MIWKPLHQKRNNMSLVRDVTILGAVPIQIAKPSTSMVYSAKKCQYDDDTLEKECASKCHLDQLRRYNLPVE